MVLAFVPAALVDRIGWLLVHSLWQFTLVALALAAALHVMRRAPARARYGTCVLAWAVMVTAPAVTWMLLPTSGPDVDAARLHAPATRDFSHADVAKPIPAAVPTEPAPAVAAAPAADPLTTPGGPVGATVPARSAMPWWRSLEATIASWLDELVAAWCLGVLLFGVRPAWGWYAVQRLRRRGVSAVPPRVTTALERTSERLGLRREVRVLQSALVRVPVVVGCLRPVILLPLCVVSGLSPAQVEAVLAHELAHVRRHDYVVNLLQTLSETIFFYHPALWWVSSRIRHEREHCCDELAAEVLGSRAGYGRALLALEELRGTAPVLSLGARGGSLLERIQRLAGAEPSPPWGAGGLAAVALVALVLTAVLALAQIRAANDSEDATRKSDVIIEAWTVQTERAVVKGRIDASHDLVMRIDRDGKPLEWRDSGRAGPFEVLVENSDKVPLTGGKSGHGIMVTIWRGASKAVTNIDLSGGSLAGTFSIRRKADVVTKDGALTFADVTLESGKKLPVSLRLEKTPEDAGSADGSSAFEAAEARADKNSDASEAPQPPQQPVTLRCVDAEGKPVAGAEVHLFQYNGSDSRYVYAGPFTSDEQGRAVGAEALFTDASGHFDRWIYARVPGRLVGVARSAKWKNRQVINQEFQVKLQPSHSVEGQVTVPQGFDPTKVTVRVQTLHVSTGPGDFAYESFPREATFRGLDTALPEIFERRPDAEGRIRFDDVPVRGRLYLLTVGDGLGEAQWMNEDRKFDEPITLSIDKEGSLTGRVLSPDGKPAVGVEVSARLSSSGQPRMVYLSTFRTVTSETGDFVISGLPRTEFVLSALDPEKRWTFRPREGLLVTPGEVRKMTLEMETGVLVTGRVLDPQGKPVEGAALSAIADSLNGPGLSHTMTDANGRYEFRLPAGGARLYFNSLPDGFVYPRPQIVKHLEIKPGQAAIEELDFTLQREPDDGG